jgi:methanethiol S-methyltransferase
MSDATAHKARPTPLVWASVVLGMGSLLALAAFLFVGSFGFVDLGLGDRAALSLDAILCCLFFAQHSVMIRERARRALTRHVGPSSFHAVYSVASGVVLLVLIGLWQPAGGDMLGGGSAAIWISCAAFALSFAAVAWAASSLGSFDPFGVREAAAERAERDSTQPLAVAGAYRWVRHPLYLAMLVMIWSKPAPTADRLLFNVLWTGWIVLGTMLEERDLSRSFGERYREYRARVPMLVPWRLPSD